MQLSLIAVSPSTLYSSQFFAPVFICFYSKSEFSRLPFYWTIYLLNYIFFLVKIEVTVFLLKMTLLFLFSLFILLAFVELPSTLHQPRNFEPTVFFVGLDRHLTNKPVPVNALAFPVPYTCYTVQCFQ